MMTMENKTAKSCYFMPVTGIGHVIYLPDGVEVIIGRKFESGIVDLTCSKHQLTAKADYSNEIVEIQSIGKTPCYFDNKPMVQGQTYSFKSDQIIELVRRKLIYKPSYVKHHSSSEQPKVLSFTWRHCGSDEMLMCTTDGFDESKTKVSAFDLDGTLIKTKSGRVFGKDFDDWMLWDVSVKSVLQKLSSNDYKIVIFTNQAGLGTVNGKNKVDGFKKKVENIINCLGIPVQVYIAISNGLYRKPSPGMWYFMKERSQAADISNSFYVGDAAGRPENWKDGKKADFSASDRLFAINIGLRFYTPEEYFLNQPVTDYAELKFHPVLKEQSTLPNLDLPSTSQEVILMVGLPGSGKSHFVRKYIKPHGYFVISRDEFGTWQKCVSLLKDTLKSKRNAVVDNINPDRASRERFIEVCKNFGVQVRCFMMDVSLDRCLHNNKYREIIDCEHEIIGSSLIITYNSSFEPPTLEEGFASILKIPFVAQFDNKEQEHFYNCYLIDK